MFDYARSNTHFLLYVFNKMRNQLIDNSEFNQSNKKHPSGKELHLDAKLNSSQQLIQPSPKVTIKYPDADPPTRSTTTAATHYIIVEGT